MVKVVQGTIIECDAAVKQIILKLDEVDNMHFVLEELDETHLFVDSSCIEEYTYKAQDA
ncbi:general transcription factor IIH subunit 5-like protein [Polychytrium aggregatum]|uniref:general transcription factor IIH subunit 5-like protein n=1 Tax=Polychytrium aggregatum TaxID=110093 RepID=UPI0022FEABC4|nr:general transcription factor IIH subunit 5-like protein [Polychytrium aggregatum]KAI9202974.1 general transcription factor IIH subunit 5-like protein [Polychytrium aggregatum]